MRKEIGLVLAGVVAFDLGTVFVPAQAADGHFIKMDDRDMKSPSFNFQKIKFDDAMAANKCVAGKGTLVEFKGDKYCRTAKAGAAAPSTVKPATAVPPSQRK